jgi:hypothetical protein
MLVGRAIKDRRDAAQISVKFGVLRSPAGSWIGADARPASVKNFLGYTLKRLGVDHIDVYRPGRLDPAVAVEDTIGAIAEMVTAGYVRSIGLSEVGVETIRRAHAVHPIGDLQIEYSLVSVGRPASIRSPRFGRSDAAVYRRAITKRRAKAARAGCWDVGIGPRDERRPERSSARFRCSPRCAYTRGAALIGGKNQRANGSGNGSGEKNTRRSDPEPA